MRRGSQTLDNNINSSILIIKGDIKMCLDQLRKFKAPVYGYKVFRIGGFAGGMNGKDIISKLYSVFQGELKPYPINKILDEKYFRTEYNKKQEHLYNYSYGFHIFQTLKSAKMRRDNMTSYYTNYAIYKVEIIEPHTTGLEALNDTYCHVIVSKKMRVIEKIC